MTKAVLLCSLFLLLSIILLIKATRETFAIIKVTSEGKCLAVARTFAQDDEWASSFGDYYNQDDEWSFWSSADNNKYGNWQMFILSKDGKNWDKYYRRGIPRFALQQKYCDGRDTYCKSNYEAQYKVFNYKNFKRALNDENPKIGDGVDLTNYSPIPSTVSIPDDGSNTKYWDIPYSIMEWRGRGKVLVNYTQNRVSYSIDAWKKWAKDNGFTVIGFSPEDLAEGYAPIVFVTKNRVFLGPGLYECDNSQKNQQWTATSNGELKNTYSDLCLTIVGDKIEQDYCKALTTQKFEYDTDNKVKILSNDRYLSTDGNGNIIQETNVEKAKQFSSPSVLKCTLLASDGCDDIAGKYFALDSKSESEKDYQKLNEAKRRFGLCYQALQNGNRMICVKEDEKFFNSVEGLE